MSCALSFRVNLAASQLGRNPWDKTAPAGLRLPVHVVVVRTSVKKKKVVVRTRVDNFQYAQQSPPWRTLTGSPPVSEQNQHGLWPSPPPVHTPSSDQVQVKSSPLLLIHPQLSLFIPQPAVVPFPSSNLTHFSPHQIRERTPASVDQCRLAAALRPAAA
jgi:hypothetical protein